jgi:alkylation response protein AidB-like acyl-CoA dehydrogenase
MDFSLTEDQELLRSSARNLLRRECPTALVRAHLDDPAAADPLWAHLRGWTGLAEGPLVDLCLFMEETGAVAAPGPFFATTALFAPLVAALGNELLPRVLDGSVTGTLALAGPSGQWVLNADPVKTFVPEADRVDMVAVVSAGPAGPEVVLGERPGGGVDRVQTVDGSRHFCSVIAAEVRGPRLDIDAHDLDTVIERATVALAAEMLGTTRWMFDATLAYAKVREQFGKPIGSFQAVQHKLANMALAKERAWSAVYYAAMALDAGDPDGHRAAHVAKAAAGSAARLNLKDGIQIHGGIGYTWDHDLHLFIRRAVMSDDLLGPSAWHHDRLGDLLVAPTAAR